MFIYLYAVETKGRSLEETAVMFDDPNLANTLNARANTHGGHLAQDEKSGVLSSSEGNDSNEKVRIEGEQLQVEELRHI